MGIFSKIFVSDKLGSWVRHSLTTLGGVLITLGSIELELSEDPINMLIKILTNPEIMGGVFSILIGKGASSVNKKRK